MQQNQKQQWFQSICELKQLIYSQPVLKMHWEQGISLCQKSQLAGKNGDYLLSLINKSIQEPPSYSSGTFVGLPISSHIVQLVQNQNGRALFSDYKINMALKKILNDYCKMLLTAESTKYLTNQKGVGWFCEEANAKIHNEDFKINPNLPNYGYKCWNDWFIRQFKDGMRPVGASSPLQINQQDCIVNSCESIPILHPKQPQRNCLLNDKFWLKESRYSLNDMFGGSKYKKQHLAKHFQGGTVYQAYISSMFYHRWHAPVNGQIQDIYQIDSCYYFDQSQFKPIDVNTPTGCGCEHFLACVSTRKVVVIKSDNPKIGKVAIIYVGMGQVSCCVSTVKVGERVKKGDQLGYFMFGGSTHALVFQKQASLKFSCQQQCSVPNATQNNPFPTKQNINSYLAHIE